MNDFEKANQLINLWLKDSVVDGIDFWGPKVILGESANVNDNVIILLEGLFTLLEVNEPYPTSAPNLSETDRLSILCDRRRKRIMNIHLIEETLDLVLTFEDNKRLYIFGDFGSFKAWKVQLDNPDYAAVIACPNKELAFWEPSEKESSHVRVEFCFSSEWRAFDLADFSKHFSINPKRSWSIGDPWMNGERFKSVVTCEKVLANEEELAIFLHSFEEKEAEINYLKNKYDATITVELINNIFDDEMPYSTIPNKQLQFLGRIGAEVRSYIYNYKG